MTIWTKAPIAKSGRFGGYTKVKPSRAEMVLSGPHVADALKDLCTHRFATMDEVKVGSNSSPSISTYCSVFTDHSLDIASWQYTVTVLFVGFSINK
jgi:hypothetical protein